MYKNTVRNSCSEKLWDICRKKQKSYIEKVNTCAKSEVVRLVLQIAVSRAVLLQEAFSKVRKRKRKILFEHHPGVFSAVTLQAATLKLIFTSFSRIHQKIFMWTFGNGI